MSVANFNPPSENCPKCPVCGNACYWHPGENSPEINSVSEAGWCCSECGDTLEATQAEFAEAVKVAMATLPTGATPSQIERMAHDIIRAEVAPADLDGAAKLAASIDSLVPAVEKVIAERDELLRIIYHIAWCPIGHSEATTRQIMADIERVCQRVCPSDRLSYTAVMRANVFGGAK